MRTQYEWLFMHMTVTSHNATEPEGQDIIVYSVSNTSEDGEPLGPLMTLEKDGLEVFWSKNYEYYM